MFRTLALSWIVSLSHQRSITVSLETFLYNSWLTLASFKIQLDSQSLTNYKSWHVKIWFLKIYKGYYQQVFYKEKQNIVLYKTVFHHFRHENLRWRMLCDGTFKSCSPPSLMTRDNFDKLYFRGQFHEPGCKPQRELHAYKMLQCIQLLLVANSVKFHFTWLIRKIHNFLLVILLHYLPTKT